MGRERILSTERSGKRTRINPIVTDSDDCGTTTGAISAIANSRCRRIETHTVSGNNGGVDLDNWCRKMFPMPDPIYRAD
jgi:hypothetical protein